MQDDEQTENEKKLAELFRKWREEHKEELEGTLKGAGYDVYSSSEGALGAIRKGREEDKRRFEGMRKEKVAKKAKESSEQVDSEDSSTDKLPPQN